jgi:hypothetical protein
MNEKVVLNRKYYEELKKDYINNYSVIKITASYIRDMLYNATIEAKTDNPTTHVHNITNVEKAIHHLEDLTALFSDEELDKEQFEWENRDNANVTIPKTNETKENSQNNKSHLRLISNSL